MRAGEKKTVLVVRLAEEGVVNILAPTFKFDEAVDD